MSMSIIVSYLQNFMAYRNTVIEDSSSIFHKIASAAHYDKISGKLSISKVSYAQLIKWHCLIGFADL